MLDSINIPWWLLLLLIVGSAVALLDRLLWPGVRWFLRRRVNRVIDEVNTRLNIHIRPFQFTKRQVLIDRLSYDPRVMDALRDYAQEKKIPREVAQAEVRRYAREIVPAFNAYAYFRIGYALARKLAHALYRVRANFADPARLANIDPRATVVFVMNHRSNMDYVLTAFLAAEQSALSYAVGEWARIWPLQQLIRAMGAYFVRRKSNNPLYRRVLERYVHMATEEGVCQAVFPEGGLSRDGCLQAPRLGIFDYMLREHDPNGRRDIVFVPVGINYDRVLEDRTLLRSLDKTVAKRSRWFVIRTTCGFVYRNLRLMLRSRWKRFGYAAVNFGPAVSVQAYCKERDLDLRRLDTIQRHVEIDKIVQELMQSIAGLIPAAPLPIAVAALLHAEAAGQPGLSAAEWQAAFLDLTQTLHQKRAYIVVPEPAHDHTFDSVVEMLRLRRFVREADGRYRSAPAAQEILRYYANSLCVPGGR
ncbi:MAG: glycerol-3-phosphate acyltransferase [Burkholderiaceae bacterium]|nr:MAG: glycerol-3-phosphate acyltransferase [Burkholderiaceae bacterium]